MSGVHTAECFRITCPSCGRSVYFYDSVALGDPESVGPGETPLITDATLLKRGMELHINRCME